MYSGDECELRCSGAFIAAIAVSRRGLLRGPLASRITIVGVATDDPDRIAVRERRAQACLAISTSKRNGARHG